MDPESFVVAAVFLLIVTSVTVALSTRLGLGSVIGLLIAGVIVGPHTAGPALTHHVDDLRRFTELGVVLLLFVIGLELQPARLVAMRREVFGLGSLQIVITAAAIAAYAFGQQVSWQAALIVGLSLALSSTAFVMQLLQDRGEVASSHGTTAFAVLLMQDLAVVPIMAVVPLLAGAGAVSGTPLGERLVVVAGMLALVAGFGRFVAPFALERLARQANREGLVLVVLLSVFLAAAAMHQAGASMSLGAFLMGILLSRSRYHLQVQALVEPFKGLLMSVFFVAVGMSVDLGALGERPGAFARDVAVIMALKVISMGLVCWIGGLGRAITFRVSFLLAQGGEFGFVIFGSARALGVMDEAMFTRGIVVISVTMLLTPPLARLGEILARRAEGAIPRCPECPRLPDVGTSAPRVIIGGYGRVGHTVAAVLARSGISFLAVDRDPARVARGKADGFPVYYGDIGDLELLAAAGAGQASLVVLTVDREQSALRAVTLLRSTWPALPVIARARDLEASGRLLEAGATQAFPEAVESSLRLAGNALEMAGVAGGDVDQVLGAARTHNYALVRSDAEEPEEAGATHPAPPT